MITPNADAEGSLDFENEVINFFKKHNHTPYIFYREECFYHLILKSDEEAIANAKCNPGTLKVVNHLTNLTVFDSSVL